MLKDIHLQMWIFMMEYIKMKVETNAAAQEEILKFLFQLSFCRVGDCYPVKPLSESQQVKISADYFSSNCFGRNF